VTVVNNGSTALSTVVTATRENARLAQKVRFCRPRMTVEAPDKRSDTNRTATAPRRKRRRRVRVYDSACAIFARSHTNNSSGLNRVCSIVTSTSVAYVDRGRSSPVYRGENLPRSQFVGYGLTWLIRVPQLARVVRVPPQLPNGAVWYCASVHVCAMYSLAIQMVLPSTAVAP